MMDMIADTTNRMMPSHMRKRAASTAIP